MEGSGPYRPIVRLRPCIDSIFKDWVQNAWNPIKLTSILKWPKICCTEPAFSQLKYWMRKCVPLRIRFHGPCILVHLVFSWMLVKTSRLSYFFFDNPILFLFIFCRKHDLFYSIEDKIVQLMELDHKDAIKLFLEHSDKLSPQLIVEKLTASTRYVSCTG